MTPFLQNTLTQTKACAWVGRISMMSAGVGGRTSSPALSRTSTGLRDRSKIEVRAAVVGLLRSL